MWRRARDEGGAGREGRDQSERRRGRETYLGLLMSAYRWTPPPRPHPRGMLPLLLTTGTKMTAEQRGGEGRPGREGPAAVVWGRGESA